MSHILSLLSDMPDNNKHEKWNWITKTCNYFTYSQYLASLQLDPNKLKPERERLPQVLLEKCAAISVQPNAISDLITSMQCKLRFACFQFSYVTIKSYILLTELHLNMSIMITVSAKTNCNKFTSCMTV